ncbi:ogr/Delta-like zinc finger family protein [Cupriavidus metallidurans]|uniref:Transcriptional regulator n=1 Tax=Cupriavidus metallidurans TaxID=119219 RepID=A0A482IR80_9BURK|nr:ogr/Delta-like zinc finger family protein [Cupriavidus metallidurans]QBP10133.1 transcriptional regulator [Cupriavidus metallidurans]QWC87209.1 ogr/Delta-like zinc finger family protein [Cupriavidus metallidurans]
MKMLCPHCETRLHIRTSRAVSLLSRELYVQCPNVECAYTCKMLLSAVHTIAPSMMPNPKAYLPQSKARCAGRDMRQLDLLPT